jgi:hypothetical protein
LQKCSPFSFGQMEYVGIYLEQLAIN